MSDFETKKDLSNTPAQTGIRTTPMGSPDHTIAMDVSRGMGFSENSLISVRNRYELLAELGRGGMGIVVRARDRETDEIVALKVLRPEVAAEKALVERFKDELRLARKITHKNVCRTYELMRFDETVVIAMEYVEGDSLRTVLDRFGGVPLRKGIDLARQMCSALHEAHTQGVVHRDLKPENLMIDRAGNIKVMDFGISRSIDVGATNTGAIIGTPAYMAPEQAEGKPVDARTDIYSLGLILYEMFTGRIAFKADTPLALAMKQIRDTPSPPREVEPTLPEHVEKAILKCLEKSPGKRFSSAMELESALTQKDAPVTVVPKTSDEEEPLPEHLARWQRSDWALMSVAAVAVVAGFLLYDRVLPFGAMELQISREEATKQTQELVAKYVPEAKGVQISATYQGLYGAELFPGLVMGFGLAQALEELRGSKDSNVQAWWVSGKNAGGQSSSANFDQRGKLLSFYANEPASKDLVATPAKVDDVLPLARQFVEENFGVSVRDVAPIPYVYHPELPFFRWVADQGASTKGKPLADLPGGATPVDFEIPIINREIFVSVSHGRLTSASVSVLRYSSQVEWYDYFRYSQRRWNGAIKAGFLVVLLIFPVNILLFLLRRMFRRTFDTAWGPSFLFTSSFYLATIVVDGPREDLTWWLGVIASFGPAFLICQAFFSVPEYYLEKVLPLHLKTLRDIFRLRFRAHSTGLALLRGTWFGFSYVTLTLGLLWILCSLRLAAGTMSGFGGTSIGSGILFGAGYTSRAGIISFALVNCSFTIFVTLILIAQPIALLRRVTARVPLVLLVIAMIWIVTATSVPGALAFPLWPLYFFAALQGVCFAWIFLRYDLLTCFSTMFTVTSWFACFPLLRIFARVDFWNYSVVMIPWIIFVLVGTLLWLGPELATLRRRTTAVFE